MSWKKDFRPVHVKVQYMQLKLSVSVSGQFLASVVHDQKIACFFSSTSLAEIHSHNARAKVLYLDGSISQVCCISEGKKNLDRACLYGKKSQKKSLRSTHHVTEPSKL
jgi:hypothetical protein